MLLNLETDYAIRIIDCLAAADKRLDGKTIAAQTGVTQRFSLKILHRLVSSDLVKSYKGAKGGYVLARPADEITLLEVVEKVSGGLQFSKCQCEVGHCTNPQGLCRFRDVFDEASNNVRESLRKVTFDNKTIKK
ncbi:MAG: Rrf2 family transcriptional regulator [Oscillospiraceae bacterium]|nr:Rrf2 family transcriptional regulator [Oscillospiraceae bacterium]